MCSAAKGGDNRRRRLNYKIIFASVGFSDTRIRAPARTNKQETLWRVAVSIPLILILRLRTFCVLFKQINASALFKRQPAVDDLCLIWLRVVYLFTIPLEMSTDRRPRTMCVCALHFFCTIRRHRVCVSSTMTIHTQLDYPEFQSECETLCQRRLNDTRI